jgi:hypothetical protein
LFFFCVFFQIWGKFEGPVEISTQKKLFGEKENYCVCCTKTFRKKRRE